MRRTFLNFDSNICVIFEIFAQPNSRKMSPSELLYDHVSLDQDLSNMYRVVAPYNVVLDAFILGVVLLIDVLQEIFELAVLGSCAVDWLVVPFLKGTAGDGILYIRRHLPSSNII